MTQRDDDIAQLEAKLKCDKLFKEWRDGYMGRRRDQATEQAEDSLGAEADDRGFANAPAY